MKSRGWLPGLTEYRVQVLPKVPVRVDGPGTDGRINHDVRAQAQIISERGPGAWG